MKFPWFSRHRKVDAMLEAAREGNQEQPQADVVEEKEVVFTGIDKHFLERVGIRE